MRTLLTSMLVALIVASSAFSGSYSSSANLYGPAVGEVGYGSKVSENFLTKIDPALPLFRAQIPASSVVGDLVYVVGSNTVALSKADAEVTARVDGYVYEKISSTEARVRTAGRVGGYTGLVAGTRYYLSASTSGKVTDVPPTAPDLIVEAGVALDSTTLVLYSRPNPAVESGDLQTAYDRGLSVQSIRVDSGGSIALEDSSGNPIVVVGDDGFQWEPRSSPRMMVATDPGHVWFTNATPDLGLLQWSPYYWNGTKWSLMFADPGTVLSASNVNVGGVGVYDGQVVSDLQFRGIDVSSSKLSINFDAVNNKINLDLGFVALDDLSDVTVSPSTTGDRMYWDADASTWTTGPAPIDTATNYNVGGVGVYDSQSGSDLRFRGVNAGSAKIGVTLDAPNREIDIDLGTVYLNDLFDVNAVPLLPGDVLSWNGTTWSTSTLGGTFALDGLSDVVITGPVAAGQILAYNGTNWVNQVPVTANAGNSFVASFNVGPGIYTNTGLSVSGLPTGYYLLTFNANVYDGPNPYQYCECYFWNSIGGPLSYTKTTVSNFSTGGGYLGISNAVVYAAGGQYTVDCRGVTYSCYLSNLQMSYVRLY